jgi:hypothetical protein
MAAKRTATGRAVCAGDAVLRSGRPDGQTGRTARATGQPASGPLRRAIDWLVPAESPAAVVYGAMVMGALLAAESGRKETYVETFASAVIAALLYWLAHSYATVLGQRLRTRETLTPATLVRGLADDRGLLRGAAIPLLALLLAWATGASQQTAVDAGLYSVAGSLFLLELLAGLRSRARHGELALEVAVGATLGLGVLALRIVLH